MMDKHDRNARIQKIGLDKFSKSWNHIPSCYNPPPPPFGSEEGWDLQFCKWWGWNWVKKEGNHASRIEDETLLAKEKPLRDEMKRVRGAGDIFLQKSRPEKPSYFKYLRSLFMKMKHTSSLQKFFNTPSVSHYCYGATCNYGVKEKISEPISCNKECYFENKGHTAQSWFKDDVDSSGSYSISICPSFKIDCNEQSSQSLKSGVNVIKTDSFQQTHKTKKAKKKKYYHLVCSNCYPQICCCRCHKQTDSKEIQHSCPIPAKEQNYSQKIRTSSSSKQPKEIISDAKTSAEPPPGYFSYQNLPPEDPIQKKYLSSLKQNVIHHNTYQVSPVHIEKYPQGIHDKCGRMKEELRYPDNVDKKQPYCSYNKDESGCRHGTHPLCSDHVAFQKLVSFDDCFFHKQKLTEDQNDFNADCRIEEEVPTRSNREINEEYLRSQQIRRHQYHSNELKHEDLKQTHKRDHSRYQHQAVCTENKHLEDSNDPNRMKSSNLCKKRPYHQEQTTCEKDLARQQSDQEKKPSHCEKQCWVVETPPSRFQEFRPRLKSQSYSEWPSYKEGPPCHEQHQVWSSYPRRTYVHERKRSKHVRYPTTPVRKQQEPLPNFFIQECPTYQKLLPFLERPTYEKSDKKPTFFKRPPYASYAYENVPCKKPRMCDIPEKEEPYRTYQDWNRVTFGKTLFPKFGAFAHRYPHMHNTKSDILDKFYSFKLEEEFFSPVSGKSYNLTPRSIDVDFYTNSSLPEPIDVDEDLKYLQNLEASVKVNHNSRVMLDAICDGILFRSNSTLHSNKVEKDKHQQTTKWESPTDSYPSNLPVNFEVHFMDRVENLVKNILNSAIAKNENDSKNNNKTRSTSPTLKEAIKLRKIQEVQTESQESSGHSFVEQVNKFNHLFEEIDAITKKSKANVDKIQDAMNSLSHQENQNVYQGPMSENISGMNLELYKSFRDAGQHKHSNYNNEDLHRHMTIDHTNRYIDENQFNEEPSYSDTKREHGVDFNMDSQGSDVEQQISNYLFDDNDGPDDKFSVSQKQVVCNSRPMSIPFSKKMKNQKLRPKFSIKKKRLSYTF